MSFGKLISRPGGSMAHGDKVREDQAQGSPVQEYPAIGNPAIGDLYGQSPTLHRNNIIFLKQRDVCVEARNSKFRYLSITSVPAPSTWITNQAMRVNQFRLLRKRKGQFRVKRPAPNLLLNLNNVLPAEGLYRSQRL